MFQFFHSIARSFYCRFLSVFPNFRVVQYFSFFIVLLVCFAVVSRQFFPYFLVVNYFRFFTVLLVCFVVINCFSLSIVLLVFLSCFSLISLPHWSVISIGSCFTQGFFYFMPLILKVIAAFVLYRIFVFVYQKSVFC